MSNQQSSSNLDEAIDRAVRRIVEVEPPPGLEGRVFARLAAPGRRGLPLSMGWAAAAAMLALVLAAGVMLREQHGAATGTPAVLSSRAPGESAQQAAEVDEARASQAARPPEQLSTLIEARQPADPAAMAPPPFEAKASMAVRRDEREMAAVLAAGPGTAAAVASRPESRSRAAVAATPVLGTALASEEAPVAAAAADAAGAAAKTSADRLEISPLRLPPLRIAPLTIAPIPETDRQP